MAHAVRAIRGDVDVEQHVGFGSLRGGQIANPFDREAGRGQSFPDPGSCSFLAGVDVDPIQIEQVILNLVHNGFEAMSGDDDGERLLTIRTAVAGPSTVEVAVSDNGPGVPLAVSSRLFDAFFTTKREGFGLGLSISRSIAEAHEGNLTVGPNTPRGATFRLTLPAARRASDAAA